jgi:hypothetical protein
MLYVVPKGLPSEEPIIDNLTMKMVASRRRATHASGQFLGFHTCVCGAQSENTDLILPNGLRTNHLCVHYLAYHRAEIEPDELSEVAALSDGSEYPNSYELHGGAARRRGDVREIDRRRQRYEARAASFFHRLLRLLSRVRARLAGAGRIR